jgi:L-seryl-tRNA(Ser) seleniumtransferase
MSTVARPRPPSVEQVLVRLRRSAGHEGRDPQALAEAARAVIDDERRRLGQGAAARTTDKLASEAEGLLSAFAEPAAPRVLNGTGVLIHTNLGRAPWPRAAMDAAAAAASGYLLLELDPETGRRGARHRAAEKHLIALTGAEDALVTNNNAAAVALAVGLAGRGRGVAVSRGELVEIGGGVRIPEIVRRAGARLVEVGTTNRTRVADFEPVLADGSARLVLRVHPSNFRQTGFTETPDPIELAAAAHRHNAIVVDDLGSGALLPTERYGLTHEPTPAERLAAGADLVTFSGDKLLGGPQAGLVVGRADLIDRLRRDPLARAMRSDKVTLAAIAATLGIYRSGTATADIPIWRMIAMPVGALGERARAIASAAPARVEVVETLATVGGGSLPGETLPSFGIAISGRSASQLASALRRREPSVIGRIEGGRVVVDLRSIDPEQDLELIAAIRAVVTGPDPE